jgi:hypothetical protein
VQVQQRLTQRVEAGDPHFGWGERVHPGDDADAGVVGVGLEHHATNRGGVGEYGQPGHLDRKFVAERGGDLLGLVGHLPQGVGPVEALAAGEEPDTVVGGDHFVFVPSIVGCWPYTFWYRSCSAST